MLDGLKVNGRGQQKSACVKPKDLADAYLIGHKRVYACVQNQTKISEWSLPANSQSQCSVQSDHTSGDEKVIRKDSPPRCQCVTVVRISEWRIKVHRVGPDSNVRACDWDLLRVTQCDL